MSLRLGSLGTVRSLLVGTLVAAALAATAAAGARADGEVSFHGLGFLDEMLCTRGSHCTSAATAISDDGGTVVGYSSGPSGTEAFRWTERDGMVGLGDLPNGLPQTSATDVSADGSVVVGTGATIASPGGTAFRWSVEAGMVPILPEFPETSAVGVSADGRAIVGEVAGISPEAYLWRVDEPLQLLGFLVEFPTPPLIGFSTATAISSDGLTVVGSSFGPSRDFEAFRWTQAAGMVALSRGSDQAIPREGLGVSPGGSVVVGETTAGTPFLWTAAGGVEESAHSARALDVSDGGRVVVGRGLSASGLEFRAFVWTAEAGYRELDRLLEDDLGVDLHGWSLSAANGVSADGRTIVGVGRNPASGLEAWVLTLPPPPIELEVAVRRLPRSLPGASGRGATLQVLIYGEPEVDLTSVDPESLRFGPGGAKLSHPGRPHFVDADKDGIVDLLARFRAREAAITGLPEACVTGTTDQGSFHGCADLRPRARSDSRVSRGPQ